MIVSSDFRAAPWLRNAHLQTIYASKARRTPPLDVDWERLELPDGDFLDLAWVAPGGDGPLVLVLHGLTGSIESKYARGLLQQVQALGWRGVLMQYRGAGAHVNRLPRSYHSGETGDLDFVVRTLQRRYPRAPLAAVGYSLGANMLLKWLGERGPASPLQTAVAVSVPFDLERCAHAINQGMSRAYQAHLLAGMRAVTRRKFATMPCPIALPDLKSLKTFFAFDDAVTAPLHGFTGALDYYRRASCEPYLRHITTPTLIIHALDDPFMAPQIIPAQETLSAAVRMELSQHGGHVGFEAGNRLGKPYYWLEQRIPAYLRDQLGASQQIIPASEPVANAAVPD